MTVALVEYGDFACPYCANAYRPVKAALARLDGRVDFAFRHFPLPDRHPHALRAAQAAEAARAQGRFEAMHDALFEHREHLEDDDLRRYAAEIGLDVERFAADLASERHAEAVLAQRREGEALGVTGTPAFFIDGERYTGFYDADALVDALEDAGA